MTTQELYLKTIFCCMACDGDIATQEVAMVREMTATSDVFGDLDVVGTIDKYVEDINANGARVLNAYLKDLKGAELNDDEQKIIVDLAVKAIKADKKYEYSEVKFFKKIRSRLTLSDEAILADNPDIEDWLLPDINVAEDMEWNDVIFSKIDWDLSKTN